MVAKKIVSNNRGRPPKSKKDTEKTKTVNMNLTQTGTDTDSGFIEKIYCRKCMREKKTSEFFKATDVFLDTNGYQSVCRDCCKEIYLRYYSFEHDLRKSIYRTCKTLNWLYTERAIDATERTLNSRSTAPDSESVIGTYRSKLSMRDFGDGIRRLEEEGTKDLTFKEFSDVTERPTTDEIGDDAFGEKTVDLKDFWGSNFTYDQYVFLEAELARWKATHLSDTYAQISLLKELCYKELEIRNARVEGNGTSAMIKEKQDLMKTASVDPAKANAASFGQNKESFGLIIKQIEETEPAEFYKDKDLFKDFDNLAWYFEKYLRRPLKNFITGSRDFNVDIGNDDDDEYDDYDKYVSSSDSDVESEEGVKNGDQGSI